MRLRTPSHHHRLYAFCFHEPHESCRECLQVACRCSVVSQVKSEHPSRWPTSLGCSKQTPGLVSATAASATDAPCGYACRGVCWRLLDCPGPDGDRVAGANDGQSILHTSSTAHFSCSSASAETARCGLLERIAWWCVLCGGDDCNGKMNSRIYIYISEWSTFETGKGKITKKQRQQRRLPHI